MFARLATRRTALLTVAVVLGVGLMLTAFPLAGEEGAPRFLACQAERDLDALLPLLPGAGMAAGALAMRAPAVHSSRENPDVEEPPCASP